MTNKTKCWMCENEFEYEDPKYRDVNCPHCQTLNSIYNPDKPDWIPPATEKKINNEEDLDNDEVSKFLNGTDEEYEAAVDEIMTKDTLNKEEKQMVIPKMETKSFPPFLKQAELETGVEVIIKSEFSAPENPKINNFLIGDVEMDGEIYTLGLNQTSYIQISKILGDNTKDWVGKEIVYRGMQTMGKGRGHLWIAK